MDFQDCIKFAQENPVCCIATAEGDQPRVRFVRVWRADDTGFYFQTESTKAYYKQMKNNGKVEICLINQKTFRPAEASEGPPDLTEKTQMRVTGEVEFLDDLALKEQYLEGRPFVKLAGIEKADDPRLILFRIPKGEAFFWSLADTTRESEIPRIKFGGK